MAKIDTKNLVLHGIGTAYILSADGTVQSKLGNMQDMSIEITSTTEDVFGGDSLFPIFNFIKEKGATFKFTNAVFDLDTVAASQGTGVTSGGIALGHDEVKITSSATTLSITKGVDVDSVMVTVGDKSMKRVTDVSTGTDCFKVTDKGAITFSSNVTTGTAVVDYVYTVDDGSTVDVLTTSVPGYVELRHESFPTELEDGRKVVLTTRIYKARCEGGLTLDYKRGEAVAPQLSFKSVDPKRADHKFVSYSVRYV